MENQLEKLIKLAYRRWKKGYPKIQGPHPDEETIACFLEGRLLEAENEVIRAHLISCDRCIEAIAIQANLQISEAGEPPAELIARVKNLIVSVDRSSILEIILKIKERILEIVKTNGDILVGQELVPAPLLRSRQIKDLKDEVTILKDFENVRVEVKIESKQAEVFDLTVITKEKQTYKLIKDLRITLLKDDVELESYLTDIGTVTFEHVLLGKYTVEIATLENKLATISLDIKT